MPQCFEITKMMRVQDGESAFSHEVIKQGMIKKAGQDKLKEETVYHGTTPDIAKEIGLKGFNRSYTLNHRFGHGSYCDAFGQVARHHAKEGCIVVANCVSTKIGETRSDSREPPPGADIGGSGSDYDTWFRVSFKDNQFLATYILYVKNVRHPAARQ